MFEGSWLLESAASLASRLIGTLITTVFGLAAVLFACARRPRRFTLKPRRLESAEATQTSDSSTRKPKTPFVPSPTFTPQLMTRTSRETPIPGSKSATKSGVQLTTSQSEHEGSKSRPSVSAQFKSFESAVKTPTPFALRPPPTRRDSLPHEQIYGGPVSLMAALKRVLPIHAYEPLGILQAACEELRFASRFLDCLSSVSGAEDRMCSVAAFVLSGYSALVGRKRKPFNPLLGETFDFISEDGWKYHAEQVSHHPSISAAHAQGPSWEWWQTLEGSPMPALDGSVSATPFWPVRLRLVDGEEYSWNKVTTIIQNARSEAERRVLKNEGEMLIRSSSGCECRLMFAIDENSVKGKIKSHAEDSTIRLFGHWDRGLNKILASGKQESLFEVPPPSELALTHYGFTRFTMSLNELHDSQRPFLPPTDSRFRPDQRHLENGEPELADEWKRRLEKEQRDRLTSTHRPLWFEHRPDKVIGQRVWRSNERYWTSKQAQFRDEDSKKMIRLFSTD